MATVEEVWVTKDGVHIPVGKMSDEHARNTLRMLIRQIRLDKKSSLEYHRKALTGELVDLPEENLLG